MSTTMTLRIDEQVKERIEQLAKAMHRSKSFIAAEAINHYLTINEWQISEIKKGLIEAEAGDFVDHSEVMGYWERKLANSLDENSNK